VRGVWLSVGIVTAFGLSVWVAWFVGDPPLPGWEWAIAGFLSGGNLGIWVGRRNGERNERERAAMQPQLDYMADYIAGVNAEIPARYATDEEAHKAGQRVMQKHAKSLQRLADLSEADVIARKRLGPVIGMTEWRRK
jgi:hypothetical protein